MKILLLGAGGQVGHELCRTLAPLGSVSTLARQGHDHTLDLTDLKELERLLARSNPELVVNAAAYTAVDQAEDEPALCFQINQKLPAVLARYSAAAGAALVHYSTDYVFDGGSSKPYAEDSAIAPIGVYGKSKYAGEIAIRESGCRHLILRTAWVYANRGRNFLRTIVAFARQRPQLQVVDDQIGTPTWARSLAQLTAAALAKIQTAERWHALDGTYHVSATGVPTSWYGFADAFLGLLAERIPGEPLAALQAVSSDAYPTRAQRPAYSVLNNGLFERRFGLRVPTWERQLRWCMEDFVSLPEAPNGPAATVTNT